MTDIFRITMLPAQDGDCLLVEVGEKASPYRLLIDGGRAKATPSIRALLASLPAREAPLIDVLVLTHVDEDHIEGLLTLLEEAPQADHWFDDVWFNGRQHLWQARGVAAPQPKIMPAPRAGAPRPQEDVLSVAQGNEFAQLIARLKLKWNDAFGGAPVMTELARPLPALAVARDAVLTILGPPKEKLATFAPNWPAAFAGAARQPEPTLRAARDRPKVTRDNLGALAKSLDQADTAKPNGSSIVLALQFRRRSALFAADAHPNDLAKALRRFAPNGKRAVFTLVKAAHHGSARNNTTLLMQALEGAQWLISTDGSRHYHPDPEAIARIVLNGPPGKELVFNYLSDFNKEWAQGDLQAAFGFTARHMTAGRAFSIDLMEVVLD